MLSSNISKSSGLAWLATCILFILSAILLFARHQQWWIPAAVSITVSQLLILSIWQDAKVGTIANILLVISVIAGWGVWQFEQQFRSDARNAFKQSHISENGLVTEEDIKVLPVSVQKYLRYVGVLNKPKVHNMRLVFDGRMREKGKDWFPLRSVQYNFYDIPERLFFMKGHMFGMDVPGYHNYTRGIARMDIKLFGLFPIIAASGKEMNQAETVTLFNDMCFLAPATLIDRRIQWFAVDDYTAKAVFTSNSISISAVLKFNEQGQLINFFSNDRYAIADMKQYQFSTPVRNYKNIGGYNLSTFAEAVWHYPEGPFTYGEFKLKDVTYNVNDIAK